MIADTSSIAASTEDRDGLPGSTVAFLQSRARVREQATKARLEQLRVGLLSQKYFISLEVAKEAFFDHKREPGGALAYLKEKYRREETPAHFFLRLEEQRQEETATHGTEAGSSQ